MNNSDIVKEIKKYNNQIKVITRNNGHFTLKGLINVHYYPFSKNKSAYIENTTKSLKNISIRQVVELCSTKPNLPVKEKRKSSYKQEKRKLLKKTNRCHWCNIPLNFKTATIDHVIPLTRGGLNNLNNMVLSCDSCNNKRGSDMPELDNKIKK